MRRLNRFGLWAGSWMTLARLLRCQPWGTSGLDFVPEILPEKSRWYMPWRYARWHGTNSAPPTRTLAGPDAAGAGETEIRPATLTCIRTQRVSNRSPRWSR